ncbi:MAG: hypothetical protein IK139_06355, partial [Lachnospiraceae bacterium]|nr:hypothetical protein [Lachnospiraceae bacterium]
QGMGMNPGMNQGMGMNPAQQGGQYGARPASPNPREVQLINDAGSADTGRGANMNSRVEPKSIKIPDFLRNK